MDRRRIVLAALMMLGLLLLAGVGTYFYERSGPGPDKIGYHHLWMAAIVVIVSMGALVLFGAKAHAILLASYGLGIGAYTLYIWPKIDSKDGGVRLFLSAYALFGAYLHWMSDHDPLPGDEDS